MKIPRFFGRDDKGTTWEMINQLEQYDLTDWEETFLTNLQDILTAGRTLTTAQKEKLEDLYAKKLEL